MQSARNYIGYLAPDVVHAENNVQALPLWMEMAYYALSVYAIFCTVWGISVRLVGFGAFALLGMACLLKLGERGAVVRRALTPPILCAATFVAVQILVHGESLGSDFISTFLTWIVSLVVLQSLSVRRGFLHRFALVCFGISLMTIPYMRVIHSDGVSRVALDRAVSLANPNDLGAWFGFCCIYFIILGIETRRLTLRISASVMATASLVLLGLTVSRGPLIAVAIAAVIGLRRTLKRGFVPLLMIIVGFGLAYGFGVFDQMLGFYTSRGATESGRTAAWPIMFQRIINAPLMGVGIKNVATFVPVQGGYITPHNSFVFFPLAGGILPYVFFLTYIGRACWRAVFGQAHPDLREDQPFRLPLLIYAVLSCVSLDYPFMSQWGVVCFSIATIGAVESVTPRLQRVRAEHLPRSRRKYAW